MGIGKCDFRIFVHRKARETSNNKYQVLHKEITSTDCTSKEKLRYSKFIVCYSLFKKAFLTLEV